jgi:hypothetical protein
MGLPGQQNEANKLGTSIYRWQKVVWDDSLPPDSGSDGCGNRGFLGYLLT